MRAIIATILLWFAGIVSATAHDSRPLFVELTEIADSQVELTWTAPATVDAGNAPQLSLEKPCVESRRGGADPRRQSALYECKIADAALAIDWPAFNPSISTLVRVEFASGETRTAILDPSQDHWRGPAAEDFKGVSRSYFLLGIEHILGGIDHLLFLTGLLIIAGTPRRTFVTVTGFTLAHSATLALVALGLIVVSVPATEAVIALSIVFLATEIARGDRTTLAWRRPVLVASAFGLVHGAGFAAALGEIGLPKTETIAALLFFNLGVEAGQIAVVIAAFSALAVARRVRGATSTVRSAPVAHATRVAGYALGVLSGYWFIERLAALFSA
ncbi:MAG: HupE/UreJ family protein [Parvularculaceae bacterium]|nr:HupE/UreJ family protein [Parvularculaceae bacterium]